MSLPLTITPPNSTTAFDAVPCGIYELSPNLTIQSWNREMANITGYSPAEAIGQSCIFIRFFQNNDDTVSLDYMKCLKDNTEMQNSIFLRVKNGEYKLVFVHGRTMIKGGAIFSVTDISRATVCEQIINTKSGQRVSAFQGLIGKHPRMNETYKMIELAADSTANVLITGESGTGKELIARAIHRLSSRAGEPFVVVNCSALSESLLESELFGHVKGAFTGAIQNKPGKFEAADGGTVFLDEIGDISPLIQLKLLRVIQEKTINRVGDNEDVRVNMKIITATNKDLWTMVTTGTFREDLYYRLKVFPILTVPLRERKNDIPLLTDHFIGRFNRETGKSIAGFTPQAYQLIMDYCWPGNVRELENCVEHAFVLCDKPRIDLFDLPQELRQAAFREGICKSIQKAPPGHPAVTESFTKRRAPVSRTELARLLKSCHGSRSDTARALGISRVALWKKIKKFGLDDDKSLSGDHS